MWQPEAPFSRDESARGLPGMLLLGRAAFEELDIGSGRDDAVTDFERSLKVALGAV